MKYLGNYFDGEFVGRHGKFSSAKKSPSDLNDEVMTWSWDTEDVDSSVRASRQAFLKWARLSLKERRRYVESLKKQYEIHQDLIAETISREVGKPLWESQSEVKAMIGKIDVTLKFSLNLVEGEFLKALTPQTDGRLSFQPRGVMAILGPFNFPGHLPNGHIVPALITGNTVVFKPSPKTPTTGQLIAEMIHKAGFPKGVFNMIQGDASTSSALTKHPQVDGVLFTGSFSTGLQIKKDTLEDHGKILALEMGGKNSTVILEDADIKQAVQEMLVGAFLTAGQRCSSTSRLFLQEGIFDTFVESFLEKTKKIQVGHWKSNVFMGPLIDKASYENYFATLSEAKKLGATPFLEAKPIDLKTKGYYVSPSVYFVENPGALSSYENLEIFAPHISIYKVKDFDEALAIQRSSGYGLAFSLFTSKEDLYEKALLESACGVVNWNFTTNGANGRLPFGGRGKSGNDRPSAHFAVNYCTVPVASLIGKKGSLRSFPGLGDL